MIGDGKCQQMCNVPQNFYDNGDCCLPTIIEHVCDRDDRDDIGGSCICHEDQSLHPGLEGKEIPELKIIRVFISTHILLTISSQCESHKGCL